MKGWYKLVIVLLLSVYCSPTMAQVGAANAGNVGAAVKAEAVNENLNDTARTAEQPPATENKATDPDKEKKKKFVFTGAGIVTIIIIAASVRRRRKAAQAQK